MDDIHNVFMYFAGLADKDGGEKIDSPIPDTESKIVKEPVGCSYTNYTLELSVTKHHGKLRQRLLQVVH